MLPFRFRFQFGFQEKSINLGILHTMDLQQGEEFLIRRCDGPSSLLDLNSGMHTLPLILCHPFLQASQIFALTLTDLLLALTIGLAISGHSDL